MNKWVCGVTAVGLLVASSASFGDLRRESINSGQQQQMITGPNNGLYLMMMVMQHTNGIFSDMDYTDALLAMRGRAVCSSASSDPDGDGWGWENNQSCVTQTFPDATRFRAENCDAYFVSNGLEICALADTVNAEGHPTTGFAWMCPSVGPCHITELRSDKAIHAGSSGNPAVGRK